jgi:Zn-dependent M28 family amino/carboxypeptidase
MHMRFIAACCGAFFCLSCIGAPGHTPTTPSPAFNVGRDLALIAGEVSQERLRAYIDKLVSFGTRHTLSDQISETRGIGAARRWVEDEFKGISERCGGCLDVITVQDTVQAPPRVPEPTLIANAIAIKKGSEDSDRVIIIQAHLDSRVSDVMNFTDDAPGANDDASGVAAVIESARILSKRPFRATIVFAALSGEEQGLHGGRILADYAKQQGWNVLAVLNNDIVGNSHGMAGVIDDRMRVFSEGVRSKETDQIAASRISAGGEVDAPSRNLARYIDAIASEHLPDFDVSLVYRRDRVGRGGDQIPMVEAGFPAVRLTEAAEHYHRQHQDLRIENGVAYGDTIAGVDFEYLAQVTRLNAMTLAALAQAPPPPLEIRLEGAVSTDTRLSWTPSPGAGSYVVWWRETTSPVWQNSLSVPRGATTAILENVVIDDWFFGVQAVSEDGFASPVQFAGPVGAFAPAPD